MSRSLTSHRVRASRAAGAAALAVLIAAGCSSSKSTSGAVATSTTSGGSPVAFHAPACTPPVVTPPAAPAPVAGSKSDWTITSFDGTKIRAHWFPVAGATAAKPAPTVLMGPGWSLPGDVDTSTSKLGILGAITISELHDAGYNVLTWDPRGFGMSGGSAETDSADYEGRDVQALLSWVAAQPSAQLDRPSDPRVGMVGASYGGGIQFVTAAIDCRVDVLVPTIAWHSLGTSLYKTGITKSGWSGLLMTAATGHHLDPHINSASKAGQTTGTLVPADVQWFTERGPAELVGKVNVPTLIVQGTVDTLFTLDEGVTNYRILHDKGVPVAMLWFCSGHGVCLTKPGDPSRASRAAVAWLAHYLKGQASTPTGPRFSFVDQNGKEYTAGDYPLPLGAPITADGAGTLQLVATGGAGPAKIPADSTDFLAKFAGSIMPGPATNAVSVPVPTGTRSGVVLGAPQVTLTYSGTVKAGDRPTRVFAQLVDETTGVVLGNQITPIAVTLDGKVHTATASLEIVAFAVKPGAKVTLQLVATTVAYATPRLGGSVTFSKVHVSLPVAKDLTPK